MAIAPEVMEAGAARGGAAVDELEGRVSSLEKKGSSDRSSGSPGIVSGAVSSTHRAVSSGYQALPGSGSSPVTQTITKLIVAVAAGLIVLEVISQATGQYFAYDLSKGATTLKDAGAYVGLYPGQQAKLAAQKAPAQVAAAHPTPGVA